MGLSVHCAKLLQTPPTYESTYLCTFFIFFRLSLFRILPILDFKRGQKGPPSLAAELLFEDAYELLVIELSCATFTSIRQSRGIKSAHIDDSPASEVYKFCIFVHAMGISVWEMRIFPTAG